MLSNVFIPIHPSKDITHESRIKWKVLVSRRFMNGGDNGFPSGNGENTQLSWAVCSESCFLLISLGVIGITCRLRYSTPLSIFSKGQCTSFQKKKTTTIWRTVLFNKSAKLQACVPYPRVKNIRQRKKVKINNWISKPQLNGMSLDAAHWMWRA